MEEWQHHVKDVRTSVKNKFSTAYCGVRLGMEYAFLDAAHAVNTIAAHARIQPCPECVQVIIGILNRAE